MPSWHVESLSSCCISFLLWRCFAAERGDRTLRVERINRDGRASARLLGLIARNRVVRITAEPQQPDAEIGARLARTAAGKLAESGRSNPAAPREFCERQPRFPEICEYLFPVHSAILQNSVVAVNGILLQKSAILRRCKKH